jgi:hypothetical protein
VSMPFDHSIRAISAIRSGGWGGRGPGVHASGYRRAIPEATLRDWSRDGVTWHGPTDDVAGALAQAHVRARRAASTAVSMPFDHSIRAISAIRSGGWGGRGKRPCATGRGTG